ncbi:hypothetical protein [Ramlibacter pallidus]|uniref:Uncharacterized protein n=1 Tax=Ramlibacter pallidus TaxID=2780087 RepID=A0ABR9S5C9_9BURK|nr:hypothetical protein [Ramlibacter pallidus]MBE7368725.1 hypothetical protein [Ramlibacter pallidus]
MPEQNKDVSNNPPGERQGGEASGGKPQPKVPGDPPAGLKDKDAETSDSYGDTRDSGDPASR